MENRQGVEFRCKKLRGFRKQDITKGKKKKKIILFLNQLFT